MTVDVHSARPKMFPRLIFFDLEGTLLKKHYEHDRGVVAPSAWPVLAAALGQDCLREEEETQHRWACGGYSGYVEWMRDTIEIHRRYNLTEGLFEAVLNSVTVHAGVVEAFTEFRSHGVITAVISGGFKRLGDYVQKLLKIDHSFCGCEYFFDADTGLIEHFNLLPTDVEGKVDFMNLVAKEHGMDPSDCAFVGDGKNDVALADAVGASVAFNAQPELRAVATKVVEQRRGAEHFGEVRNALCGIVDRESRKR